MQKEGERTEERSGEEKEREEVKKGLVEGETQRGKEKMGRNREQKRRRGARKDRVDETDKVGVENERGRLRNRSGKNSRIKRKDRRRGRETKSESIKNSLGHLASANTPHCHCVRISALIGPIKTPSEGRGRQSEKWGRSQALWDEEGGAEGEERWKGCN